MPEVVAITGASAGVGRAAMGGEDRATENPWILLALAAKAAFDAVQDGKLAVDQWKDHGAFCIWCLLAADATFATVPLVMPEARAAFRHLSRGSS